LNSEDLLKLIHERLERNDIEGAVTACFRHARVTKDLVNSAVFLMELNPNGKQLTRALRDELSKLKPDSVNFVVNYAVERWAELHDLGFSLANDDHLAPDDRMTILNVAVAEIESELNQAEKFIGDLTVPPGLQSGDAASLATRFAQEKSLLRLRIKAIQKIRGRLKTRCLEYVTKSELQYTVQRKSQGFLETVQNDVNNFFKARSEEVYVKLLKAAQLSSSTEEEDAALLLTEVRRALKSAADYFYPPRQDKVICGDGIERTLGEEQYLNRLQEFVSVSFTRATAKELLSEELEHLSAFIRRLNDLASKGVHSAATLVEAKQSLVGLYFFLFNASQRLTQTDTQAKAG
jgi:hypothetical protein